MQVDQSLDEPLVLVALKDRGSKEKQGVKGSQNHMSCQLANH